MPLTDVGTNNDGLNHHLQTPDFFDTANHPTATYVSRSVTVDPADPTRATVEGDLTLRGVTKPVALAVKFNQAGPFMNQGYRAGFDAEATVKRSEFGIAYGIPAPGTTLGVGDKVEISIEAEFSGPDWADAPPRN